MFIIGSERFHTQAAFLLTTAVRASAISLPEAKVLGLTTPRA
jgi:hypothetical protein